MPPESQTLSRDQYAPIKRCHSLYLARQRGKGGAGEGSAKPGSAEAGVAGVQELRSGRIKPRIPIAGEGGVTSPEVVESWENATAYRSLALA